MCVYISSEPFGSGLHTPWPFTKYFSVYFLRTSIFFYITKVLLLKFRTLNTVRILFCHLSQFSLIKFSPSSQDPFQYEHMVTQLVKNLLAMWETWVRSLGWEDPLEKGTANPLQYCGLENPTDRKEPGGLSSMGSQRVGHNWATFIFTLIIFNLEQFFSLCLSS